MHLIPEGRMNNVRFNHQVLIDELRRVGIVSVNTAHTTSSYKHELRSLVFEKTIYILLLREIEFGMRAGNEIVVAASLKTANNG